MVAPVMTRACSVEGSLRGGPGGGRGGVVLGTGSGSQGRLQPHAHALLAGGAAQQQLARKVGASAGTWTAYLA